MDFSTVPETVNSDVMAVFVCEVAFDVLGWLMTGSRPLKSLM